MTRSRGFTLIELMIVIAIIAIIAAIAIPGLLAAQRSANQRNASASLRTLPTVQADFRANDRDGDRQLNFWTGSFFGLYAITPSPDGSTPGSGAAGDMIKLLESSMASSDAGIYVPFAGLVSPTASIGANRGSKSGYMFSMLGTDEFGISYQESGAGSSAYFGQHSQTRFAAMAVPVAQGSGRQIFLISEEATMWRLDVAIGYSATVNTGWGSAGLTVTNLITAGSAGTYDWGASGYPRASWPTTPVTGFGAGKLD